MFNAALSERHIICAAYTFEKFGNGHFDCSRSYIKECNELIHKRTKEEHTVSSIKKLLRKGNGDES